MDFIVLVQILFLTAAFALGLYFISFILRRKSNNKNLHTTYECGCDICNADLAQFRVKFIVYAIIFLLFEAECILLFPYALAIKHLGLFGLISILLFILLVTAALLFAIKSSLLRLF